MTIKDIGTFKLDSPCKTPRTREQLFHYFWLYRKALPKKVKRHLKEMPVDVLAHKLHITWDEADIIQKMLSL